MYKAEQKKLLQLLDPEIWQLFKEAKVFVAGGAITSVFCNREVNDIDVYFRDEESMVRTVAAIFGEDDLVGDLYEIVEPFQLKYNGTSQRTIMFSNSEKMVQFMTFKYFPDAQEIFDTFDFTVCMGAYDCASEEFILHEDFMKHNSQRYLKFHTGTAYPIMSMIRVDKYREKGYMISKSEMLRVLMSCMSLNITSWEEALEHIGGMYGYDMSRAFDEDKEFSLQEVMDQLSTIHERGDVVLYGVDIEDKGKDFWDLAEKFWYHPEDVQEEEKIIFNDDKYLYKCVDGEWKSPYRSGSTAVHYVEGRYIEVPVGGLYFHPHSTKPYHVSNNWVECEVIEGVVQNHSCEKVVVRGGCVKVVRTFNYNFKNDKTALVKWMNEKYGWPSEEGKESRLSDLVMTGIPTPAPFL